MKRKRVAILISGRGSNMMSLIEAARHPDYPALIALVVSNRPDAQGLARAAENDVATATVDHKDFEERAGFERELDAVLRKNAIEIVCLAGFMRVLTPWFVARWENRLVNIHPSLLPAFKGLHTHRRALEAGSTLHGCSVHLVVPDLDSGPILAQAAIPVLADDTEDSLAARVLAVEHDLYPQALRSLCLSMP